MLYLKSDLKLLYHLGGLIIEYLNLSCWRHVLMFKLQDARFLCSTWQKYMGAWRYSSTYS